MNTVLFVMMMCKASGIHSPCPTDCCGYLYRQLLCTETLTYSVVTLCCCEVLKKKTVDWDQVLSHFEQVLQQGL